MERRRKILILDYSVDGSESGLIQQWLPQNVHATSLLIQTEESFPDRLIEDDHAYVIHSGSTLSVMETAPFSERAFHYIRSLTDRRIPQMGICYGHQLICRALLGPRAVRRSPLGLEAGWCKVSFQDGPLRIRGLSESETLWQHHFDEVVEVPAGSRIIATNSHSRIQSYINTELCLFGTQFHPEYDREKGNAFFLEDRALLEAHQYHVDEIIRQGPSVESGRIFLDFFLNYFPV